MIAGMQVSCRVFLQPKWDDQLDHAFVAPARARTDRHDNFTDTPTAVVREEKVVWTPLSLAGQVLTPERAGGVGVQSILGNWKQRYANQAMYSFRYNFARTRGFTMLGSWSHFGLGGGKAQSRRKGEPLYWPSQFVLVH